MSAIGTWNVKDDSRGARIEIKLGSMGNYDNSYSIEYRRIDLDKLAVSASTFDEDPPVFLYSAGSFTQEPGKTGIYVEGNSLTITKGTSELVFERAK